jgi:hypothetical protein
MTNYLSRFKFIGNGVYLNDADNMSIALYDTHRSFRAYRHRNPLYRFMVKNKSGNDMRFRSAEAAAKHLYTTCQVVSGAPVYL